VSIRFADLPVRYKFLIVSVITVGVAVAAYSWIALSLFTEDKRPFVYEGNASLAESMAQETATGLLSSFRTLRLLTSTYNQVYATDKARDSAAQAIFAADDELVEASIYTLPAGGHQVTPSDVKPLFVLTNDAFLKPYNLPRDYLATLRRQIPVDFEQIASSHLMVQSASLPEGIALLRISLAQEVDKKDAKGSHKVQQIVVGHLRQDRRIKQFNRSPIYTLSLIDQYGSYLVHSDAKKVGAGQSLGKQEWLEAIRKSRLPSGVLDLKAEDGEETIVGYARLPLANLLVLSEITHAKAFQATTLLTRKSLVFAAQIIFGAIIISLIFTGRLTRSLKRLQAATLKASNGDFDIELKIEGKDEVGSLSKSFNRMAVEIKRLLAETADKARMEKELETAHLVQDNFFPVTEVQVGDLSVAAHFKSASECGGDWWGQFAIKDKLIILVGDATGHGVPSALITAAAYSCTVTLSYLGETGELLNLSPKRIMTALNAAVMATGKGKIKMTFFVAVIDIPSGVMTYCNASHETPLIARLPEGHSAEEPRPKEALDTLISKPDPVLGREANAEFHEYSTVLAPGDVVLWYTDGLVEGRNGEGKEYGENRLLRVFNKVAHLDAEAVRTEVMTKAGEFWAGTPNDDDITLIVLKRGLGSVVLKLAS